MIDPIVSEGIRDGIVVAVLVAGFGVTRRWLTKDLRIVKAAVFRLLRSNRVQGKALESIAECQKEGKCNGSTDAAISAVRKDRSGIANWLRAVLMGQQPPEEDEDESEDP